MEMEWLRMFCLLIVCQSKSIEMLKAGGIACPYTGSFLAHKHLFLEALWVPCLKMEEASFSIERKAKDIFQFAENDLFYVNHLSGYEHDVKNKENFQISEEKSQILSQMSVKEECSFHNHHFNHLNSHSQSHKFSTLAVIPCYGGRPPQVTSDLKVESIGQGNSLVNSSIKALQCLSTTCSTLRYFNTSIIAVATLRDKQLIEQTVSDSFFLLVSFLFLLIFFHSFSFILSSDQ